MGYRVRDSILFGLVLAIMVSYGPGSARGADTVRVTTPGRNGYVPPDRPYGQV